VIVSGGKQYRVAEGELVRVEELGIASGERVEFKDILLVRTDGNTYIGQPRVAGATVLGTVEDRAKSDKVLVFKYKKKKQYRRTRGHRQQFSAVRIQKIEVGA
jgi:large subunit ribosomal protein L21